MESHVWIRSDKPVNTSGSCINNRTCVKATPVTQTDVDGIKFLGASFLASALRSMQFAEY